MAAGGSAGHVEPALTLADTLTQNDPAIEIVIIGTDRGIENQLVPPRGYRLRTVPANALPRRINADLMRAPARVTTSVRAVIGVLDSEMPDVVIGFGGYVALPAYLAARRRSIPLVVHEANARAGIANRVGARLTRWRAQAVPGALHQAVTLGMPLRQAVRDLAQMPPVQRETMRDMARDRFGLARDAPTLLVFGGSLGARHLNQVMGESERPLARAGIQVLHLTGTQGHGLAADWPPSRGPGEAAYVSMPYLVEMHEAFAAADLVVSRAGATTCAELAALGLPAIYVPLPVGNGEQALNARPVVAAGGGVVIDDVDLSAAVLVEQVREIFGAVGRLDDMSRAARVHGVLDASDRLADMVCAAAALGHAS